MLKLNRYSRSGFYIGDNIYVKVLRVYRDGCVEIGVKAPPEIKVFREELVHRNKEEQREKKEESHGRGESVQG